MKKYLLISSLLILLISCQSKNSAYYLESESMSFAYIANSRHAVKIDIDKVSLTYLESESGKSGKELFEEVFTIPCESYAYISDDLFNFRQELFNSLKDVTSSSDTLHAFSSFRGDLRKTDFIATINNISSDFDDAKLSKNIKKKTTVTEYHLKNVISTAHSYSDNREFISRWVENIMGNI